MFEDIGNKIKKLAKVITWVGIGLSIVIGIMIWSQSFIWGLLVMIIGALGSWVGSFLLYGFGELIENTEQLNEVMNDSRVYTRSIYKDTHDMKTEEDLKKQNERKE